jgi:hypothetical protein
MHSEGASRPTGSLGLTVIRGDGARQAVPAGPLIDYPSRQLSIAEIGYHGMPRRGLPESVNAWRKANQRNLRRGVRKILIARAFGIPHMYGQLFLTVMRADGSIEELGLAGMRVVTTVGVKFICDDLNNSTTDCSLFKFHGFGTGATTEAVSQTALLTEVTNTLYVGDVRPTGSQASATVSNDATYTTVGTFSPDSGGPTAVTEHGIFSANAVGTLLDKSGFAAVNLTSNADSLQATYVFTLVAGS